MWEVFRSKILVNYCFIVKWIYSIKIYIYKNIWEISNIYVNKKREVGKKLKRNKN